MTEPLKQVSLFRTRAATGLRVGVALVLLAAALMKAHQLATTPSLGEGLLHARWFNQLVVLGELAFAAWLFSGLLPKPAWLLSVLCFSVFAVVSGYKYWIGEGSCGCFGNAAIPPLWTALFDTTVVGLLIVFRPVATKRTVQWDSLIGLLLFMVALMVPVAVTMGGRPSVLDPSGKIFGQSEIVELVPADWVGRYWPLEKYCDLDHRIVQGNWRVLFYRENCEKCHRILEKWQAAVSEKIQTAMVLVPEANRRDRSSPKEIVPPQWHNGCLSSNYVWSISTPVVLVMEDGVVIRVDSNE